MAVVKYLIFKEEGGAADEQQPHGFVTRVFQGVAVADRDVNGVAGADLALLVAHGHPPATGKYVIDLFEPAVMVRGDRPAGREDLFGKAALSYAGSRAVD